MVSFKAAALFCVVLWNENAFSIDPKAELAAKDSIDGPAAAIDEGTVDAAAPAAASDGAQNENVEKVTPARRTQQKRRPIAHKYRTHTNHFPKAREARENVDRNLQETKATVHEPVHHKPLHKPYYYYGYSSQKGSHKGGYGYDYDYYGYGKYDKYGYGSASTKGGSLKGGSDSYDYGYYYYKHDDHSEEKEDDHHEDEDEDDDHYYYKKPTYKYHYYASKAGMKGHKGGSYYGGDYYHYPTYGHEYEYGKGKGYVYMEDDHFHHEGPKTGVPPPFAQPGSEPPLPSPGPPTGGPPGAFECFDDASILIAAVDQYIQDPSPDTPIAQTYGFPMGAWCVSGVTQFSYLFSVLRNPAIANFNEDLSGWDVSNGVDFYAMFEGSAIDQDFGSWAMSQAEDVGYMFSNARNFRGTGLRNWDLSNAVDISFMFFGASSFNEDISGWQVGNANTARSMFQDAGQFDQELSFWTLSSVTDATDMFNGTRAFSRDLCSWGVDFSPGTTVIGMFADTSCPDQGDPDLDALIPGPFCFPC